MSRSLFTGRPSDFVILPPSSQGGTVKVAASLTTGTAWNAQTAGTRLTDLQTAAGSATTTLSTDADGFLVPFYGPDGVDQVWADFGGTRRLLESLTFASNAAAAAQTNAVSTASTDATNKANAAQAAAISATSGGTAPIVQNADGSLPARTTVTTDRTRILFYRLVRLDVAITTAASTVTGSPLPTPDDIFFYRA